MGAGKMRIKKSVFKKKRALRNSQAVNYNATITTLPLPLVHLGQQSEEGLFGVWDITVG